MGNPPFDRAKGAKTHEDSPLIVVQSSTALQPPAAKAEDFPMGTSSPYLSLVAIVISSVAAPVVISFFKSKQELRAASSSYAESLAKESRQELSVMQAAVIQALRDEIERVRNDLERTEDELVQARIAIAALEVERKFASSNKLEANDDS